MKILHRLWAALLRLFRRTPAPGTRALPAGHQYVGHTGTKARLRIWRQSARRALALKDPDSQKALRRLGRAVAYLPNPAVAALRITHVGFLTAEALAKQGKPVTWAQAVNRELDHVEGIA